jgi:hypothetical protein
VRSVTQIRCRQLDGCPSVFSAGLDDSGVAGLDGTLWEVAGGKNNGPFCPHADTINPVASMAVTADSLPKVGRGPKIPEVLIMVAL